MPPGTGAAERMPRRQFCGTPKNRVVASTAPFIARRLAGLGTDIRIRRSPTDHLLEISEARLLDFPQGLWVCIVAGMMLAVAAFIITLNPWLTPDGGFCLTTLAVGLLATERQVQ